MDKAEEAYTQQIHPKSKTQNTVTFSSKSSKQRNVFAIGY